MPSFDRFDMSDGSRRLSDGRFHHTDAVLPTDDELQRFLHTFAQVEGLLPVSPNGFR